MFKKFATLAIVATVSIAMPQDISEIPVTAEFPMPVIPWDFEAASYSYIFANGRLAPTNEFSTQRWSSTLNRIYEETGVIDADSGDEVVSSAESTDVSAASAVEFSEAKGCFTATNVQSNPVNQTIATFFDQFTYAGVQYAPWELTRVKYHRLDGAGVQYFYKQSNLQLRFFVELTSETQSRVNDFAAGLVAKTFTESDFVVAQCTAAPAEPTPFLQ